MDIAVSPKLLTDWRIGYYRYNVIDHKYDQSTEFANTLGIPGINIASDCAHKRRAGVQHRRRRPVTGTHGAEQPDRRRRAVWIGTEHHPLQLSR